MSINIDITEDIKNKMKKLKFFQYLTPEEFDTLLSYGELLGYNPKERIIQEGDSSDHLFAIIMGFATVTVAKLAGGDAFISSLGENDIFGEASIFMKSKRTASIDATDKCVLFKISLKKLIQFFSNSPKAAVKLLMISGYNLMSKLREANQELAFERKSFSKQDEVDDLINQYLDSKKD